MAEISDDLVNKALGRNTNQLRTDSGWSLDAFAKRSGVSKGMLSQIEKGATNPSIGTLCKIANTFGVTLQTLLTESGSATIEKIAVSDVANLWSGEGAGVAKLLFGLDLMNLVELWRWSIPQGIVHQSEAHPEGAKEVVLVLRGVLLVTAGDHEEIVRANQAVLFNADSQHSYANNGSTSCDFVLLVVEPRT